MNKKTKTIPYLPTINLSHEDIKHLYSEYVLNTYSPLETHFVYGSGSYLYDSNNQKYIDFLSGIAVTGLGHSHPDLIDSLNQQLDLLWHTSNLFYNQQQAMLARALIDITFPGKVFFCNSGTEANEAAIKLVKAWGNKNNKQKIIALKNSFHGRTLGSVSITGQDKIKKPFEPILPNVEFIEPDIDELIAVLDDQTAGVFLEPILGEGGIVPLTSEFLQATRELTNDFGAILVLDEIQTGMGRTGKYWCYEHHDIVPDVVTTAKGLGNGFPIGAMIVHQKYEDIFSFGMHGSTFGGNHLATAVAYEVLRTIETHNILENVTTINKYLMEQLLLLKKEYPNKIQDVRGKGLLLGVVLNPKVEIRPFLSKALEKKLIVGRAGESTIRLTPALNINQYAIDEGLSIFKSLIKDLSW